MKKVISLLLVCLFVYTLCACEKSPRDPVTSTSETQSEGVDVDLTKLSSTMVYSEVYNMMVAPDKYVGKTVRMRGQFALYEDTQSGARYFACIIADATACCSQGLEFVLEGTHAYPQDYPSLGTEITVTGEFRTYEENGNLYCHLTDAKME